MEEDVTEALADSAGLGVELGAMSDNVVESLNAILKKAYNEHTARGDAGGQVIRKGRGR